MAKSKTVEQMLTRDLAMRDGIGPDGKKWGICKDSNGWGLYQIGRVLEDEKDPEGRPLVNPKNVPEDLAGHFTSEHRAQSVIEAYLTKYWDMSDRKTLESLGPSKVAEII
jgi:hypothetical protein